MPLDSILKVYQVRYNYSIYDTIEHSGANTLLY